MRLILSWLPYTRKMSKCHESQRTIFQLAYVQKKKKVNNKINLWNKLNRGLKEQAFILMAFHHHHHIS